MSGLLCTAGCGSVVDNGQLLCSACWRQVPPDLQKELHEAWRAYTSAPTDAAWSSYAEVRAQALAAITAARADDTKENADG